MKNRRFSKGTKEKHRVHSIRGVLSVNSRAVGFIEDAQKKDDVMIETPNLNTALNRDEVEVEMLKGQPSSAKGFGRARVRGRRTGKVVRIIRRNKMRFVGTVEETTLRAADGGAPFAKGESRHRLVLVPDDFRMYAPIGIPKPPRDAQKGYKALAEIKEWNIGKEPVGEILKVIGKRGEHETEMESIVLEHGFRSDFPREAETDAGRIAEEAEQCIKETGSPISPEEIRKRKDLRSTLTFTIDPANAKDFDDALSFRRLPSTKYQAPRYEIGIHIADVSHYVREGSALDHEARERGTSVYLVDRTIPMLPHALSNDLCSLNPRVDRLAFSTLFEMDGEGRVHGRWFGKSVIHSRKRFTYESAQESMDKGGELSGELRTLNAIAQKLRAEKTRRGSIDFEQDEIGFELDEQGRPLRIFKKKRLDTHKLIEEFMLLANREVAHFFAKAASTSGGKLRFIYRIHDVPDREKLDQLRVFVRALGHELHARKDGSVHGKDLQALFNAIEGHAAESLVKTAAIRSMAKAVYSTANIGHFGLSFEYYTHFTSPIRRYPDLLVHRSLFALLERHTIAPHKLLQFERLAHDATQKEIAASEAERESIKQKQVEYMGERIGKEFDGVISGVTEWGIYVEEKETRTEGMVKLRDMGDDYYVLHEKSYAVVGEKTKKKYSLGDSVRFKVVGADAERKTLDYRLV